MDDRGRPDAAAAVAVVTRIAEVTRVALRRADVVDVFMLISERAVELLPIDAAGILVRDHDGTLHVVGASTSSATMLDLLRVQVPTSSEADTTSGSFPMVSGDDALGLLRVLGRAPLDRDGAALAQALADVAALALLRIDADRNGADLVLRVHRALQARATLGQAIGVVAERFALDPDGALRRLRVVAVAAGIGLIDLAGRVVARGTDVPPQLDVAAEDH